MCAHCCRSGHIQLPPGDAKCCAVRVKENIDKSLSKWLATVVEPIVVDICDRHNYERHKAAKRRHAPHTSTNTHNRIFTILIKYSIIHGTRLSQSPHVRIVFQMFSLIFLHPFGVRLRAHTLCDICICNNPHQTHFSIFCSHSLSGSGRRRRSHTETRGFRILDLPLYGQWYSR